MRKILFRAQEWLADHFSSVQYPQIRRVDRRPVDSGPNQLKLWEGLWLLWFGFVVLVISGALLVFFGLFLWYFITGS